MQILLQLQIHLFAKPLSVCDCNDSYVMVPSPATYTCLNSSISTVIRVLRQLSRHAGRQSSSMTALDGTAQPKKCQPIGMLQKINLDGTQIVRLLKPADGPFGFYIARGSAKYNHGKWV